MLAAPRGANGNTIAVVGAPRLDTAIPLHAVGSAVGPLLKSTASPKG
jgi:hypothetical protein